MAGTAARVLGRSASMSFRASVASQRYMSTSFPPTMAFGAIGDPAFGKPVVPEV